MWQKKQDWYDLIGTRGFTKLFCLILYMFKVFYGEKLKKIKQICLGSYCTSPHYACSVVLALDSQGRCFYCLFIKQIFLSSLCPHLVGKGEGVCHQKFITCLEDHPRVPKIAVNHRARMPWGLNGLHRLQAVWDLDHFSHPWACLSIIPCVF